MTAFTVYLAAPSPSISDDFAAKKTDLELFA
jgi:hypothetical protein